MNVGKVIKHQQYQLWFGTISNKKNIAIEATINNRTTFAIIGPSISVQEMENEYAFGLTPADRQELQIEKERLVAMLDEVHISHL